MGSPVLWTIVGILLTIATLLATTVFKLGHVLGHFEARLTAIETWRGSIRVDMHEISDKLEQQTTAIERLTTLIEERTHRRVPIT